MHVHPTLRTVAVLLACTLLLAAGAVPAQADPPPVLRRESPMPQFLSVTAAAAPESFTRDPFEVSWYTELQWPLPANTLVTDVYGPRSCAGCSPFHEAVDLAPGDGTPIWSIADGIVVEVGDEGTFGTHVVIQHSVDGAPVRSTYAHMQAGSVPLVLGQPVQRGQVIGLVGNTGLSTGPHLHFALDLGDGYIDPWPWMVEHANS